MTTHFPFLVLLSVPLALGNAVTAHAEYLYTYTELTPFANTLVGYVDNPFNTFASAINNQGQIVGYSTAERRRYTYAALWENPTTISAINGTRATAISDNSLVAGYAEYRTQTVPFRWDGTTSTSLSSPYSNSYSYSYAYGINDIGQVVGDSPVIEEHGLQVTHATLWNGSVGTDLGTLSGPFSMSAARAINASGQVAGWSGPALVNPQVAELRGPNANTYVHATVWNGTTITDLGTLGGEGGGSSRAYDINNAGQVVGDAEVHEAPIVHFAVVHRQSVAASRLMAKCWTWGDRSEERIPTAEKVFGPGDRFVSA